jgi:multiple sugar transport system ATP-binding protein
MADVFLDDVSRVYPDGTSAISRLTLRVRDGELLVIVGPSGCGKSTLLRLIAGIEPQSGGSISIGGRVVDDVQPAGRDVAMVFETGALYPHMTAGDNLRFGLAMRNVSNNEIEQRVGAESRVLRLESFLDRAPRTLSAGQRQRVAIGRATVRLPAVFLFDEPLGHLEAAERFRLRTELATLQHGLGVTAVYVTHDQSEAMAIGDRVALMRAGRIEQLGEPRELYLRPANTFVASFLGEPGMTLLAGRLTADAGRVWVVLGDQRLPLPGSAAGALRGRIGGPVTVGLRPEHVTDAGTVADPPTVLFSTAATVQHLGSHLLVACPIDTAAVAVANVAGDAGTRAGQAMLSARFPSARRIRPGDPVELAVDTTKLSLFDPDTGVTLSTAP